VIDLAQYPAVERVKRSWTELSLARQFSLAAAAVLALGMLVIGFWVTRQIEEGVTRNTASATALYVDSVIAPLLPDLRGDAGLSYGDQRALDETLSKGALGERLASFKIWKDGGLIAYASDPALIGARFEPTESLEQAWAGRVAAEFNSLEDEENASERVRNVPLLEIYSPIREPWSGDVVAVAEFYEVADELQRNLRAVRLRSWHRAAGQRRDHKSASRARGARGGSVTAAAAERGAAPAGAERIQPRRGSQRAIPEARQRRPARRPGAAVGAGVAAARQRAPLGHRLAGPPRTRHDPQLPR
jgi:hypothetical protein